jgi:hypothetical protein
LVNSTTLQKIAIEVPPISAADSPVTGVSRVAGAALLNRKSIRSVQEAGLGKAPVLSLGNVEK